MIAALLPVEPLSIMIPISFVDADIPELSSIMLSAIVVFTELLVVVVPFTVKSPVTTNAPDTVVAPVTVKFNAPDEVMVKSVPSPSIFSPASPKTIPLSLAMCTSEAVARLILPPDVIVKSVLSVSIFSPPSP